jgi:hypothetical protein
MSPSGAVWPGGDCIQIVGYAPDKIVADTVISGNDLAHCDRSGVGVHSGAVGLTIVDNHFHDTGDQDIDAEGTGGSSSWLIEGNTFDVGPSAQSQFAIELQLVTGVRVTDNAFHGRGLFIYQTSDLELDHDSISQSFPGTYAAVEIEKDSSRVNLHHSAVSRAASAGPGPVVRAVPHGTGTPDHLTIADSSLAQATSSPVITTMGLVGLYVMRNTVTYSAAPGAPAIGLQANGSAGASPIRTTDISVAGNSWTGPMSSVVSVSGSYGGVGSVALGGNTSHGSVGGLVCSNMTTGAQVLGPISSVRDALPAPACGQAGFVAITR